MTKDQASALSACLIAASAATKAQASELAATFDLLLAMSIATACDGSLERLNAAVMEFAAAEGRIMAGINRMRAASADTLAQA